jgi:hypothetical protein
MSGILLLLVLLLVVAVAGGVAFAVALARRGREDFEEQNELLPGVDSGAPASWAGAHSHEAKLHRRLIAAMQALRSQTATDLEDLTALELRVELEQHALAVDQRLVRAAALPVGHREQVIAEVEVSVVAVEQAATDLARSAGEASTSADVRGLEDLSARIKGMTAEG